MQIELKRLYEEKKDEIKKRLQEFKEMINQPDEKIFAELSFCLCTPQSKAVECDKAIKELERIGLLFKGSERQIMPFLSKVRFNENKSKYIVNARNFFTDNGRIKIKEKLLQLKDDKERREWLVKNVKGLGYKEATHFLRNIGFAQNLAILDRHVLRCLSDLKVIEVPKMLTRKKYLEIEEKMLELSKKINIPMDELDLLFFYIRTGRIFK